MEKQPTWRDHLDDLYRLAHGISETDKIDKRGKHFWLLRLMLRSYVCEVYRKAPNEFHRHNGKFVSETLVQQILVNLQTNPGLKRIHIFHEEKSIRSAVRCVLKDRKIPNNLNGCEK